MTDGRQLSLRPFATRLCLVLVLLASCAAVLAPSPSRAASSGLVFGKGLLWKVDKAGLAPSYLFGTIHSGDERVARLPPPVKKAFDRSDVFVMEVIPDPSLAARMRQAMVFSDGHDLKGLVSESVYRGAVKALSHYDIPEGVADRLKPWAIASTLSVPETAVGTPLDKRLYWMAQNQEKSIFGLETPAEQVGVLNGMSLDDQVELLKGAVAAFDKRVKIYRTLIDDYLARDISAIFKLNEKYTSGNPRVAKELNRRIFVARNGRMVKRIIPRLEQGNAFIAIGAGHLPGKDGVLKRLQDKGYRVSVVY